MRVKLALAALAGGVAVAVFPVAPASAQCGPTLIDEVPNCGNCNEVLEHADAATAGVREKAGVGDLSDQFACTQ